VKGAGVQAGSATLSVERLGRTEERAEDEKELYGVGPRQESLV